MDNAPTEIIVGRISVRPAERRALVDSAEVVLTAREFDILASLMAHPGWVFSADQLAEAQAPEDYVSPGAVNVHVSHVRSKLAAAGAAGVIETVRGVGWRLRDPRRQEWDGDGRDRRAALARLLLEARSHLALHLPDAVPRYQRAAELVGRLGLEERRASRLEARILERLGIACFELGESVRAAQALGAALAKRDPAEKIAIAWLCARLVQASGYVRSRAGCSVPFETGMDALATVGVQDIGWWRAWIQLHLAQAEAAYLCDIPLAVPDFEGALQEPVERFGTASQQCEFYISASVLCFAGSRSRPAPEVTLYARKAMETSSRGCTPAMRANAVSILGSMLVDTQDFREAESYLRLAVDLSQRHGYLPAEASATFFLAEAARFSGDVLSAEKHAKHLAALAAEHEVLPEFLSGPKAHLAWVALRRGNADEAERLASEALELWLDEPASSEGVWMMAWPALACALRRGDLGRAIECAALMIRPDQAPQRAGLTEDLSRAVSLDALGRTEEARELLEQAESRARTFGYV